MSFEGHDSPDLKPIFECPGCYRQAYPEQQWRAMSKLEKTASGGVQAVGDFCVACADNPARRDPEPGSPYEDPTCAECGAEMIRPAHWRKAGQAEKEDMLADGYVRERRGGKCWTCIGPDNREVKSRLSRAEIRERKRVRGLTVTQYLECRDAGMTDLHEIAGKIGLSSNGLRKALRNARQAGQEIP